MHSRLADRVAPMVAKRRSCIRDLEVRFGGPYLGLDRVRGQRRNPFDVEQCVG